MQHVGRMGTLVGFAFQVGAAGAAVIAPDQKWIGWALCALGLLTFAATLAWWGWHNRLHVRGWVKRVEPVHIIALGLVIALGGVIWQLYRPALSPDLVAIGPLQTLPAPGAPLPPAATPLGAAPLRVGPLAPAPNPEKKYVDRSAAHRALTDLHAYLTNNVAPISVRYRNGDNLVPDHGATIRRMDSRQSVVRGQNRPGQPIVQFDHTAELTAAIKSEMGQRLGRLRELTRELEAVRQTIETKHAASTSTVRAPLRELFFSAYPPDKLLTTVTSYANGLDYFTRQAVVDNDAYGLFTEKIATVRSELNAYQEAVEISRQQIEQEIAALSN